MTTAYPLEIFYDGNCIVCSREIDHYRRNNPEGRLLFIDIGAAGFDAGHYGKRHEEFMARLHVRDAGGTFLAGVEAFVAIWQAYPGGSRYRLLAQLVSLPATAPLIRIGYTLFARYRHLLPKRKGGCDSAACELHSPHHPRKKP
ncbi:thiol-disulfide oxidoreductase DCC family protein [Trichloromonas sp.]|uniref:thiol-disulfide oxidoreductase DCC family protein n=1 Tax=Trichloromonas sp. TaxID=3069249 RepID=UPI003D812B9D